MRLKDLYQFALDTTGKLGNIALLVGGPGAGKTSALKELYAVVSDIGLTGSHKLYIDLVYTATTNAAAQALGGKTVHSLLSLPFSPKERGLAIQEIVSSLISYFMNHTKTKTLVLVIDEAFILDAYTISLIEDALNQANKLLATQSLGVIKLVLCGDPAQLLAIGGERFYQANIFNKNIPIFRLDGVFRQSSDIPLSNEWVSAINLYRTRGEASGLIHWMKEVHHLGKGILADTLDFNPQPNRFIIAFTNQLVDGANLRMLINHCQLKKVELYEMFKEGGKSLYLAEGAPIIITKNDRELGLFKRQRGIVLSIRKHTESTLKVVIKINDKEVTLLHTLGLDDLNVALGMAGTIHTAQGSSFDEVQVLISHHLINTPGAALVAFTRHIRKLTVVGMNIGSIESTLTQGIDSRALQYV